MEYRIGVDVGGTNTDFVVLDAESNKARVVKVPSTPKAPEQAVIQGVERLLRLGVEPGNISFFSHGTTIATNALLEEKGAKIGLFITGGFRAVQEVGDQTRSSSYELSFEKPRLLAPQSLTWEIPERVDHVGNVVRALDEKALREAILEARRLGVESFAVCYLFSYMNPKHERRTQEILREVLPKSFVSVSSEVLPRIREWPRLSTTLINAYLEPVVSGYISRLKEGLRAKGLKTRQLFLMQSNGGVMPFDAVLYEGGTVRTVLSGPAAGVQAGAAMARRVGLKNVVTMDIGGTSCDVALVKGGSPVETTYGKMAGRDVHVPVMDVRTIGAGGGTIAWINRVGDLKLGPQSAGADPGPVCYGLGGVEPTTTDAAVVLGYLDPAYFLGGEVQLDAEAAKKAISDRIAKRLGMSLFDAASGMIKIVNANMANAIRLVTAEQGVDPRDLSLISFGGAGPLCASEISQELGIRRILIPEFPGAFSAMGLLCTAATHDFIRSDLRAFDKVSVAALNKAYEELEAKAIEIIEAEGFAVAKASFARELDMRYAGQGYELRVPVGVGAPGDKLVETDKGRVRRRFDSLHEDLRGHKAEKEPVELVSYRLRVMVDVPTYEPSPHPQAATSPDDARKGTREIYVEGTFRRVNVYRRELLAPGNAFRGPALVEQADCTVLVQPWQSVRVDGYMNLLVESEGA